MNKQIATSLFYLFLLIPTVNAETNSVSLTNFADQMYKAWIAGQPFPHISQKIAGATEQQAAIAQWLFVQQHLNNVKGSKISGFKAGLTSLAGQQKFKVDGAISGTLFSKGKIENGENIQLSAYRKLMLETEIGFVLGSDIDKPVNNVNDLKRLISRVIPVIELPNLAFKNLNNITGQDIVASNAIGNRYILGKALPMPINFSLNELSIKLEYFTEQPRTVINQGKGSDALGNQWKALLWLVNERLKSGYHLTQGQFLITGALGKMLPAKVGQYHADFGQLGQIDFTVTK